MRKFPSGVGCGASLKRWTDQTVQSEGRTEIAMWPIRLRFGEYSVQSASKVLRWTWSMDLIHGVGPKEIDAEDVDGAMEEAAKKGLQRLEKLVADYKHRFGL